MNFYVYLEGAEELVKALDDAIRQYPASADRILKEQGSVIARDLKNRVNLEAEGHHYVKKGGDPNPRLADSFTVGKVIHSGKKTTIAVTSKAPHYHLYEEGHDLYSHNKKNKRGKGKIGTGKLIGKVYGRKTVARYMAQRSEYSRFIAEELLHEILSEAGML